jgi:hypothetical protein
MSDKKTDCGSVSSLDLVDETYLDDTSSSPHGSDTGVVKGPVVGLGSLPHEHETLSVRHDLGSVKSLLEVTI